MKRRKTGASEYRAAKEALEWSHEKIGHALGVGDRTPYRYASGDVEIPEPSVRLLRLLVLLRMTMSARKFEEIVDQLS